MIIKALLYLAVAASIGAAGYLSTARYLKSKEAAEIARAKAEFFAAAADRAQIEKFRQLVQKFLKQDIRDADGNSAFMIACRSGNVEGIRYILSLQSPTAITKSPLFFNTNSHGHTALHEAVLAGRADVLKVILSNTLVALALASVPAAGSRKSPLHLAVANQDEVMVDVLMRLQANVNAQDRAGVSPLMVACELGNVAISARLMQGKVDLALADANGSTALHYAIKASSPTLLEAILKRHSELRAKAASAAAISPAGKKLSDAQKSTRQRKEKPAAARRESSTGPGSSSNLSRSSSMESVASASSLTSTNTTATAGAGTVRDVLDVPNWWGFSPLLASAEQGASSCFAVLIKEGADVARTTRAGENALTLAVRSGSLDMVKTVFAEAPYLLENRAHTGQTCLHEAALQLRRDMFAFLSDVASQTNLLFAQDDEGRTPLHLAVEAIGRLAELAKAAAVPDELRACLKLVAAKSFASVAIGSDVPLDAAGKTPAARARDLDLPKDIIALASGEAVPRPAAASTSHFSSSPSQSSLLSSSPSSLRPSISPRLTPSSIFLTPTAPYPYRFANLRIAEDVRLQVLDGDLSVYGACRAIVSAGAGGADGKDGGLMSPVARRPGVVVILGPRAAPVLADAMKRKNGSGDGRLGFEPLRRADLDKNLPQFLAALRTSYQPLRTLKLPTTASHRLLVALDALGLLGAAITTHVDGTLHGLGLKNIVELRGSVWNRPYCLSCLQRVADPDAWWARVGASRGAFGGALGALGGLGEAAVAATTTDGSPSKASVAAAASVVRCERPGCAEGRVVPGVALLEEDDAVAAATADGALVWERALRDAIDNHVARCAAVIVIGATVGTDTAVARLLAAAPPYAPRLLLDDRLSPPFLPPPAPLRSLRDPALLAAADAAAAATTAQTKPAAPPRAVTAFRDAVRAGGNYRDVAVVVPRGNDAAASDAGADAAGGGAGGVEAAVEAVLETLREVCGAGGGGAGGAKK